jgi:hypothetical protein
MGDRNNAYNFRVVHARQEMCIPHLQETMVALSNGYVTVASGLIRSL